MRLTTVVIGALFVLHVSPFASAQTPGFPAYVVNGASTPYTGTVVFGVPLPDQGGASFETVDVRDAGGALLASDGIPLVFHASGSPRFLLVTVTGTFAPGNTPVFVSASSRTGPLAFAPTSRDSYPAFSIDLLEIDWESRGWVPSSIDLLSAPAEVLQQTRSYVLVRLSGATPTGLRWQMYISARKGEGGARVEFLMHNDSRPDTEPGDKTWFQVRDAVIRLGTPGFLPGTPVAEPIVVDRGYDPAQRDTRMGRLGIMDGRSVGPLRMEQLPNGDVCAAFLSPLSAIPMGGPGDNRYTSRARPGDAPAEDHDPRTAEGLVITGGQKIGIRFFVGNVPSQAHLDTPPGLLWADGEAYVPYLIGGGSSAVSTAVDPDRARFETQRLSLVEESLCDTLTGHNPNTLAGFIARGGTYAVGDHRDNPHFGLRDVGDTVWAEGYNGGNHYQMTTNLWLDYLATKDARFLALATQRTRHFRTVDWVHATSTPTRYQGKCRYEKGFHHGNFSDTRSGHIWARALLLEYLLTGHPEALACANQVREYVIAHERHDGTSVDSNWVAAGNDPRNWGASSTRPGETGDRGGPAANGWQGEWGVRIPGRAISILVDDMFLLGRDNGPEIHHLVEQILRVEEGIWGGRGFILNRAERQGGVVDNEQTWMLIHLVRAIGKAIVFGGDADPRHRALYLRMVQYLVDNAVAYGWQPDGSLVPPRPEPRIDENGAVRIYRPGLLPGVIDLWIAFRDGGKTLSLWQQFHQAYVTDVVRLRAENAPITHLASFARHEENIAAADALYAAGATLIQDSVLLAMLLTDQWRFAERSAQPTISHAAMMADLFAQAALHFDRWDLVPLAFELWRGSLYHLDDGTVVRAYVDGRSSPDPIGYRRSNYPGTEEKIRGVQGDVQHVLRLNEVFYPNVRSNPPVAWFQ